MKIGSLCTGYGGLDHAVQNVLGGTVAWTSDIDKGACKIIAHRYPDVPNIGDMTTVDWTALTPIDVLTAGYPCQPFSHAGRRKGTDDERHLWPHVREAIRVLRPRLTVLENVAGHRSLGFDRVLGDLAEDGMHVWWTSLRASDIGAAHQRERLFIFAEDPERPGWGAAWNAASRQASSGGASALAGGPGGVAADAAVTLLPTPTVQDGSNNGGPSQIERNTVPLNAVSRWGDYAPAIARWEQVLGRPAPAPTQASTKGNPQLSAAFVEWLMGLPAGWVTDVPGVTRNEALKALGNGVVPQQATAALRWLLAMGVAA